MTDEKNAATTDLRRIRIWLMITGFALSAVGAICMIAPIWITAPVQWFVGGAMVLSGLTSAFHLLLGYTASPGRKVRSTSHQLPEQDTGSLSSAREARRGPAWALILVQVILGSAMLWWPEKIRPFLFLVVLLAVALEGAIVLWASLHFHSTGTKAWMWTAGFLSVAVAAASFYYWRSPDAGHLLGLLIGAKLLLIGVIFIRVGWGASESELQSAYVGLASFQDEPTIGSIYAVYYGPALHCGICVGERLIVDYHADGIVICITWEEFLRGRRAMEWNYPDVVAGEPATISSFAKSLVGKFTPYNLFSFNCENFAIYCRSVGATTASRFSQAAVGVEFMLQKPLLGSMAQLLNRGASYFLYGAGGPFGKKIGFAIIRIARALTDWVVARPLRNMENSRPPQNIYTPNFVDKQESKLPQG
jgi:uncharacterized membrane protein HdeD (DUF308 family)